MAATDNASLGAAADDGTRPRGKQEPRWDYAALPFLLMPSLTLSSAPTSLKNSEKNPHLNKNESPRTRNQMIWFVSSFPS